MRARCPACSERFPIAGSGALFCPVCGARLEVSIHRAEAPIEPAPEPSVKNSARPLGTPWEERGRLRGFLLTIRAVLTAPTAFFQNLGSPRIGRAPSFALLVLLPAVTVQAAAFLLLWREAPYDARATLRFGGLVLLASLMSIAYLGTFYQLAATLFSGRSVAVPATVRAVCFGFAPMIFAIIPVGGFLVGVFWSLFLHAVALREIHGLTSLKSFAVVATPVALVAVKLW